MIKYIKTPRILAASSSLDNVSFIRTYLARSEYSDLVFVQSMASLQKRIQLGGIDLLIVAPPLTDEAGTDYLVHLSERNDLAIILIVSPDISDQIQYQLRYTGIGVLSRPLDKRIFRQTFSLLLSMLNRLQLCEKETERLRKQLNSVRIINQAKCLLIEHEHLSEEDAHHYIETYAMDHSITKQEAANTIIQIYS